MTVHECQSVVNEFCKNLTISNKAFLYLTPEIYEQFRSTYGDTSWEYFCNTSTRGYFTYSGNETAFVHFKPISSYHPKLAKLHPNKHYKLI